MIPEKTEGRLASGSSDICLCLLQNPSDSGCLMWAKRVQPRLIARMPEILRDRGESVASALTADAFMSG